MSELQDAGKYKTNIDGMVQGQIIGDHNQVELHFHNPRDKALSSTKPQCIWNIPYLRNDYFTGREEILKQLHTRFKANHATALSQRHAMSGLGGVGKTQTAVEYAYRYHQDYQAVLWVLAESRETLTSSFVEIAILLDLPQKDEKDQAIIVQAVKRWLQDNGEWLLILDNVDEPMIIREFLPTKFDGHILLTTRAQALGGLAQRIEVDTFTPELGALFLLRRAAVIAADGTLESAAPEDCKVALQISKEQGGLPLALDQAGVYIEKAQCSLSDYQSLYRTRRAEMLKERGGLTDDHPEPVATTWSLSFEKVKQASSLAAEVLHFCSFLAPDAIPEELLIQAMIPEQQGASWEFNEALVALRTYSLIQRQTQERLLRVHRLVQAVVRDSIKEQEQVIWITCLTGAIETLFPWGNVKNWKQCERYLSQALICAEWMKQKNLFLSNGATLCINAGWYLHSRAQYKEAEPLYWQALRIWEQSLGPEHPQVASPLNNLAMLCNDQGKYREAEPLYQRALHIWEQSLGPEHPQVAYPLNNLADLYSEQGKYGEVEPLYQRALHIWEQSLGPLSTPK